MLITCNQPLCLNINGSLVISEDIRGIVTDKNFQTPVSSNKTKTSGSVPPGNIIMSIKQDVLWHKKSTNKQRITIREHRGQWFGSIFSIPYRSKRLAKRAAPFGMYNAKMYRNSHVKSRKVAPESKRKGRRRRLIPRTSNTVRYLHVSLSLLSFLLLSSPLLSYPFLSSPILSYPILSYPILSYPPLSLSSPLLSSPLISSPISLTLAFSPSLSLSLSLTLSHSISLSHTLSLIISPHSPSLYPSLSLSLPLSLSLSLYPPLSRYLSHSLSLSLYFALPFSPLHLCINILNLTNIPAVGPTAYQW